MPKKKIAETELPTLSKEEIVRAALNNPELSNNQFQLGDKTYTIVDLSYDDYMVFISMLQPVIDQLMKGAAGRQGINLNGVDVAPTSLSTSNIITYCSDNLPRMVQIICRATEPEITIEQIKKDAKNPFKLADIVLQQVIQNNMIRDFATFFRSVLPLMKQTIM